jgi:hypothetical protein
MVAEPPKKSGEPKRIQGLESCACAATRVRIDGMTYPSSAHHLLARTQRHTDSPGSRVIRADVWPAHNHIFGGSADIFGGSLDIFGGSPDISGGSADISGGSAGRKAQT